MIERIDDPGDPRLDPFRMRERGLTNRRQRRDGVDVDGSRGMFVAEGDLVVERALAAGCEPVAALVDAATPPAVIAHLPPGVPVYGAGHDVRRTAMGMGVALSAVALFRRPVTASVAEVAARGRRLVVIEAVDNPANVGSILRAAAALGWDGALVDRTSADPLSRRALRVSMGVALSTTFARGDVAEIVAAVRGHDATLLALTPSNDAIDIADIAPTLLAGRVAVAIGAERAGLSDELAQAAHHRVRIPMSAGVDSLNAAAAAAIALYVLRSPTA